MPSLSTLPLLLIPLAIPVLLGYFLQYRPRKRAARATTALQQSLAAGDRVVTRSGLHATVVSVAEATVELETCPGVLHRYDRASIVERRPEVHTGALGGSMVG